MSWTRSEGCCQAHALTVLRIERRGCFHGYESYELKEVVLHHIANETDPVEVASATLDSNVFLEGDGDRRDMLAVPNDDLHHTQANGSQVKKRRDTSTEHPDN